MIESFWRVLVFGTSKVVWAHFKPSLSHETMVCVVCLSIFLFSYSYRHFRPNVYFPRLSLSALPPWPLKRWLVSNGLGSHHIAWNPASNDYVVESHDEIALPPETWWKPHIMRAKRWAVHWTYRLDFCRTHNSYKILIWHICFPS